MGRKRARSQFCTVSGCQRKTQALGLCSMHYTRQLVYGRLDRIKVINRGVTCKVKDCDQWAKKLGYCAAHYQRLKKYHRLDGQKYKKDHPLYSAWWNRKTANILCEEWSNDFWKFVEAVGERPGQNFALIRLRDDVYGPDNFQWREHLRRRAGESQKDWWARKWQARKLANPGWDDWRRIRKHFGLTQEQYTALLNSQNGVCAICKKAETGISFRTGNVRRLAIDHCHTTGKIRALLCWRCNSALGKMEESIELLHAMEDYIRQRCKN